MGGEGSAAAVAALRAQVGELEAALSAAAAAHAEAAAVAAAEAAAAASGAAASGAAWGSLKARVAAALRALPRAVRGGAGDEDDAAEDDGGAEANVSASPQAVRQCASFVASLAESRSAAMPRLLSTFQFFLYSSA
jgi:hypothetical protein